VPTNTAGPSILFHGLFEFEEGTHGRGRLRTRAATTRAIPDPQTGKPLRVASIEVSDRGVCPACAQLGAGGYVSFVSDLRLAFACPSCRKLVFMAGA
jgi:hypothetical protein